MESVTEIGDRQQFQMLHSILSDNENVDHDKRLISEAEVRMDGLFGELMPLIDSPADRQSVKQLQARAIELRPVSDEITQLIEKQQMDDALKLITGKLLPACDDLERAARAYSSPASAKSLIQNGGSDVECLCHTHAGLRLRLSDLVCSRFKSCRWSVK